MTRARSFLAGGFRSEENRRRGESLGLGLGLALSVSAALSLLRGQPARMETAAAIAAVLLGLGLILPQVLYPPARALEEAFKLLTRATMYLLLALVFYLVFAPVGIALRLLRRDPLRRRLDPAAKSYWLERKKNPPERAEKQF